MLNDLKRRAARARAASLSALGALVELLLIVLIALLVLTIPTALAHPLALWLAADQSGRVEPWGGAALSYRSMISSDRVIAADGNSLRSGWKRSVDPAAWGAHKAGGSDPAPSLAMDAAVPLQVGASAVGLVELRAGPFVAFKVRERPAAPMRMLLVMAAGMPLTLAALLAWRRHRA